MINSTGPSDVAVELIDIDMRPTQLPLVGSKN